ncbi:villin-like protein quail isoform X1 [Lucilia sericata]|uniref:villin-like protein quail isoform X1 n=1 Tax=Lucilia sericata TaxID=13632 RepID=UPI0018A83050|nr:villin-like protein quail isoform X1 [Lucilia sericata]
MATKALQFNFIQQEVRPNSIADVKVDASFRRIPKNAICFHVWKIEEDRLEAEPKAQYGTFLDDCAYIIYACGPTGTFVNQDTITREVKPSISLERFIHFWLGENVSEQKRSNVAHKIQELDSYFGNVATEYRETQNNESARFLSYFKKGITIKSGALLNSNDPNRLYQVYGRKWMHCIEMKNISWEHFGADYIMLLHTANHLYVWIGRSSSNVERRNAIELANKWQTNANNITIVDDGYEQSLPENRKNEWNTFLPLNQRAVSQNSQIPEKPVCNKLKIYKCCYRNNRLHLDQLDVVIPTKDDFSDSSTAYVLDGFSQGVWLWVGSQASQPDKTSAMGNGRAFVKKKKYPYSTPVIRVIEGHEPIEFKRLFPSWQQDNNDTTSSAKPISTILGKFDSLTLCQRPKMAAETQLIDDGSGERKIYRITKDQVIEMPETKAVFFTTLQSYVIQYTVASCSMNPLDSENVGVKQIIYQWNGSEAAVDVAAKAENFAKTLFEKSNQKTMFIQMMEFDETPHFLQMFGGKLIILLNDKNMPHSQNNNNHNGINGGGPENEHLILKIYGDSTYNSKAVEIYPLSSMSSKECYVVKSHHVWVWCGQSSTGDAREVAKNIGTLLGESSLVLEGKEPKEFWRSVTNFMNQNLIPNGLNNSNGSCTNSNGSSNSTNGSISPPSTNGSSTPQYCNSSPNKPRLQTQLFLVWSLRNKFYSEEVLGYEQTDLSPECVYILDAGIITYVWLGKHVSAYEKDKYLNMAQSYLETVPIARRPTTAIGVVRQQDEPNVFKGFFENWNHQLWNNYVTYENKRQLLSNTSASSSTNGNGIHSNGDANGKVHPALLNNQKDFDCHQKYPISVLQQEIDLLPAEINPLKREVHLTHDDFVSLFNMSFWEFDELPGWKKQELKKKYKLF